MWYSDCVVLSMLSYLILQLEMEPGLLSIVISTAMSMKCLLINELLSIFNLEDYAHHLANNDLLTGKVTITSGTRKVDSFVHVCTINNMNQSLIFHINPYHIRLSSQ